MKIDDGGPAFPVVAEGGFDSGLYPHRSDGMSLRDWFAGMALQGLFASQANPNAHGPFDREEEFAMRAYKQADAMLKARES